MQCIGHFEEQTGCPGCLSGTFFHISAMTQTQIMYLKMLGVFALHLCIMKQEFNNNIIYKINIKNPTYQRLSYIEIKKSYKIVSYDKIFK